MDSFEDIVGLLLKDNNLWIWPSFRLQLTNQDKKIIKKIPIPRLEIDLLALNVKQNVLYLLEAKSFIDSQGVKIKDLLINSDIARGRYKLFTCSIYRRIICKRLKQILVKQGLILPNTIIKLGLIAGKVYQNKEQDIQDLFAKKGWLFWGPKDVSHKLSGLAKRGYENNSIIMVSKLLDRIF